jgi:hypothetical protein
VLVIVSLASTLIYQTSGFFYTVYSRIGQHLGSDRKDELGRQWIQSSVRHLLPDYEMPAGGVRGGINSLSFYSLSGPGVEPGSPSLQRWQIEPVGTGSRLVFVRESGERWTIRESKQANLEFRFEDRAGRWRRSWPGDDGTGLPQAIRLVSGDRKTSLHFHVLADWNPPPKLPGT